MKNSALVERGLVLDLHKMDRAASILRAVRNPLREKMLRIIHKNGRIHVTEMYRKLKLEQSAVSQHLAVLRRASLVCTEREGRTIYYSANYAFLEYLDREMGDVLRKALDSNCDGRRLRRKG